MNTITYQVIVVRAMLIALALSCFVVPQALAGDPKSSKEIIQKKRAEAEKSRVRPPGPPTPGVRRTRVVAPRKQVRRHIHWALPTDDHNEIDFRAVLTRSTRNFGFSIEYFDDHRRREIESAIVSFQANRRDEAYDHWHRFLVSLETFDKPVDLEPVMYYVLREGCLRQDSNVLFHAERLERIQGDLENIEEYWKDLYRLHRQCEEPGNDCPDTVEWKIEDELEVLSQERDLARAKLSSAERALERAQLTSSGEVTRSVDVFYTVAQEMTRRTEIALYADSD